MVVKDASFVILCVATILAVGSAEAQTLKPQTFEKDISVSLKMDYLTYLPKGYSDSEKKWPLILFLHGIGERGSDVQKVKDNGLPRQLAEDKLEIPFIVISPQCPDEQWWSGDLQLKTLNALLDDVISEYRIDQDRIYLTGLSMGGFGTWSLAALYPDRFAAAAPICGGGNPHDAGGLKNLPLWVFHGAKDDVVSVDKSREMVAALKEVDGNVVYTEYPELKHNSWEETYRNQKLYDWFLTHTRSGNQ